MPLHLRDDHCLHRQVQALPLPQFGKSGGVVRRVNETPGSFESAMLLQQLSEQRGAVLSFALPGVVKLLHPFLEFVLKHVGLRGGEPP